MFRSQRVQILRGCAIAMSLCSCVVGESDEHEDEPQIAAVAQELNANRCEAFENIDFQGNEFDFNWPKDYNDIHRKPSFGDKISSIRCFGKSLVVYEHSQWSGASLTIDPNVPIANLHTKNMGDKISSVMWKGADAGSGTCTVYENKNFQGNHLTFLKGIDWNDLHRVSLDSTFVPFPAPGYVVNIQWGDKISSYSCAANVSIIFCKDDQWNATCQAFSGSDTDIHDNGFGDNISSITW